MIKDEYKDLCSSSEVTEFLFGNDLPNLIKELNLTHRLANTNRVFNRMKADRRSYNRYKPYTPRSGPFFRQRQGEPATNKEQPALSKILDEGNLVSCDDLVSRLNQFKGGQLATKSVNGES